MYQIQLCDPQKVLLEEIQDKKITQRSVSLTYAFILRQEPNADFSTVNKAIMDKWGKGGLQRVINKAWKIVSHGV